MQAIEVKLDPEKLSFSDSTFPRNAEQNFLRYGFYEILGRSLFERFTAPGAFEPAAALAALMGAARSGIPSAISQTIAEEMRNEEDSRFFPRSFVRLVQSNSGSRTAAECLSELTIPAPVVERLSSGMGDLLPCLQVLSDIRKEPAIADHILPLLVSVRAALLDEAGEIRRPGGVDDTFQIMKAAIENPNLVVPADQAAKLYFLSYMPYDVRCASQDTLILKSGIDCITRAAENADENGKAMAVQLTAYLKAEMFCNHHWSRYLEYCGASQHVVDEVAMIGLEGRGALAKIYDLAATAGGNEILETFRTFTERVFEEIRQYDRSVGFRFLQQVDIGHGFHGFGFDSELYQCLHREEGIKVEKNGQKAVILEDNRDQMKAWCGAVNSFSEYTVDRALTFETPEGVLALPYDPSFGLYLLDIQNGKNLRAGVDVARTLIERISRAQGSASALGTEPPHVEIIVWSNSAESVRAAQLELKELINTSEYKERVQGLGRTFGAALEVNVYLKAGSVPRF